MAIIDIPGFSNVGSKVLILTGSLSAIVSAGASTLSFPGISFDSIWVAPQKGAMFAMSGGCKGLAGNTLTVAAYVNGQASGFDSGAINLTGVAQTFYNVSSLPYTFNAGDKVTLSCTPGSAMTAGYTVAASLMVII